jgi:hypothetical protein
VASPPWNDRFRHWPLPLLDEVRFAKAVAWVLTPGVASGLPTPAEMETALRRNGGRWLRADAGGAVVFHSFAPPYSPKVEPWPEAGPAGDLDLRTSLEPQPAAPVVLRLPAPRRLLAITLVAPLEGPRLPRNVDVEVSADGERFELVASRRRREERLDLRWWNGQPQAVTDHDVFAIGLPERPVSALRIVPGPPAEPWGLAEVLLHAEPGRAPWDEWIPTGLDWEGRRRALVEKPHPEREDWHTRVLLASRVAPPP